MDAVDSHANQQEYDERPDNHAKDFESIRVTLAAHIDDVYFYSSRHGVPLVDVRTVCAGYLAK